MVFTQNTRLLLLFLSATIFSINAMHTPKKRKRAEPEALEQANSTKNSKKPNLPKPEESGFIIPTQKTKTIYSPNDSSEEEDDFATPTKKPKFKERPLPIKICYEAARKQKIHPLLIANPK